MPEATVLYSVIAVVVLGLIVWVAVVLKTAREPWGRPMLPRHSGGESVPPSQSTSDGGNASELDAAARDAAKLDADTTAKATPVALASEGKAPAASKDDANT